MKNTRKKVDVEETPTTILTQLGPMSCIPKLGRGETAPGYTKRHGKRTSSEAKK
jgi:hypothetical protein